MNKPLQALAQFARPLLIAEVRAQIAAPPEDAGARALLDQALAGPDRAEALERLARTVALGHLVRLAGLRLLAARGLSSGPGGAADWRAVLEQSAPLAALAPALLDPAGLGARLPPRPPALARLLARLDDPSLRAAWAPGREATLGWLYQSFNAEELERAFRAARLDGRKIARADLPSATQLFTPDWVADWLVLNTLGRRWLQAHPDSRIAALGALAPIEAPPAPPLLARELTVLDPACGTMHIGLAAFDLLAAIYREELERAGQPGWPPRPSVEHTAQIPSAILTHNLFGIDIDPRALELAALCLGLRAGAAGPPPGLVCAELALPPGDWPPALRQAGEVGSLLRAEGLEPPREALARRGDEAGARQALRLLELLARRYTAVVTNPPYLSSRKLDAGLKTFLAERYPLGKLDLYAAFIQRCLELCAPDGRAGLLCMHSFMFTRNYAPLRALVRRQARIEALLHFGPGLFEVGNPGTLQTAACVLARRAPQDAETDAGLAIRLVRPHGSAAKSELCAQVLARLGAGEPHPLAFRYRQRDFDAVPGAPWAYWATPGVRRLFAGLPPMEQIAPLRQGLATADNARFLRRWWEVGYAAVERGAADRDTALASGRRWFPYMKGGACRRWWGNQEFVVNWQHDGAEIRALGLEQGRGAARAQNTSFYFRRGVTYTFLSQTTFSARLSPGGFVFDVAGSSLFPQDIWLVLALLNSRLARYLLRLISPTVNFQVGDLARLPVPRSARPQLHALVGRAVDLARAEDAELETCYDFVAPPAWSEGLQAVAVRRAELAAVERAIDAEVERLYGMTEEDRAAMAAELAPGGALAGATEQSWAGLDTDGPAEAGLTRAELARRWVAYAVGIVLGRFAPGAAQAYGRGRCGPEQAAQLRALALPEGIGLIAPGHPCDLCARVEQALALLLGPDAPEALEAASGGRPLARYLARGFFREHLRLHRHRPVYWLLQSPRRSLSLLVFHERLHAGSLALIQGPRYLQGALGELRGDTAGRLEDGHAFAARIRAALDQTDERGAAVGWRPEHDDGVLLNLAPLHALVPAWPAEPLDAWQALERGERDWSRTAMRYWPERVLAGCRRERSLALAHGLERSATAAQAGRESR
jgi:hypothetical protein